MTIKFTPDGIEALARIAAEVNEAVENIGARRLQTVMEKLLEDISFTAEDRGGETLTVDAAFVDQQLSSIARNADLSAVCPLATGVDGSCACRNLVVLGHAESRGYDMAQQNRHSAAAYDPDAEIYASLRNYEEHFNASR